MPLIVDSSVAFKWFVNEPDSDAAAAVLDGEEALIAPDLIFLEIGNAMWVRLRSLPGGAVAVDAAQLALKRILSRVTPLPDLVRRAAQISFELEHATYDCVYLAMCEGEGVQMITADKRLCVKAQHTPFAAFLRPFP